jgi:lon-related putative ATP-dependent protease
MSVQHLEVPADQLTRVCDPNDLSFETTEEVALLEGTLGQERAVSAIELALDIDAPGFNLFVAGYPGTGRNTALKAYLERIAVTKPVPSDWGYVHNFQDPSQPVSISLPCGMMGGLASDMHELVEACRREIPRAFESEDYARRIEEVMKGIQEKRQAITSGVEQEAQREGFALTFTHVGVTPVPLMQGRPMAQEEFATLTEAQRQELFQRAERIQHSIARSTNELRRLNKEAIELTRQVDAEVVRFTLTPIVDELQNKYVQHPQVVEYLDQVEADVVENLDVFKPREDTPAPIPGMVPTPRDEDFFTRYRVNDLVDNAACDGAPVIFEYSPTYYNLFGRIDYRAHMGTFTTDLTMIKAGAIHRANGGYLVLQARDLILSPLSWDSLKRSLRSGEVRIENIGEQYSPIPSATLRPQPIPINTKIVLVGSPELLQLLQVFDEDFRRYFKVVADFDIVMDRTPENMAKYASFVASQCHERRLRPFHKTAVARIIDYSSRLVEDQDKLTTRFMDIADILTEANYWASRSNSAVVMGEHVQKAIAQREYRVSLTEERLRELIEREVIHIATDGKAVGQVNGLAVVAVGDHVFGKPSRITARVSLGRGQVVNIERETQMSGRIHNKGFMILTGYIQGKYGLDKPLSLAASIGFEQTYSEVEGDSASSTELYALISELSGLPIAQDIAVTGSVNQVGQVQAIGGATYKIEGFFEVCKARGLTGSQGVMVPRDNLKNLVLKQEVIEAVREGRFHIYAVSTIDEGIEVLTGAPAGQRQENGAYPEGTVHYLVEKRLLEMAQKAREFGKPLDSNGRRQEQRDLIPLSLSTV